jgi:hypothetical protein
MRQLRWSWGLLAVAAAALAVNAAHADRVPTTRTVAPKSSGSRTDITVPYTTNGNSNFGVAQGVSPRIYKSPNVEDSQYPDTKRVYNLPFWGGSLSFGDRSEGATPRPPGPPFPGK